ncbi:Prolyl 4-hydroxylase subunit alpha-1 [Hondaea fermentalgiana]|uniref:Prolyl 4-hydroxylase subunit alpha-1 n=1 Tax=Hondaea fermentalgiana TaxID=2315210 RepID=A0A2R5GV52_9STRA|nr:Prolyl 4-hydroxylase subunit alpha-1 [Hondaea fermentalgiana]|eukprot:GBG31794.1 Prolyl 4-hydroxylase subunit alpha-1 [Hondaea fermentalgiana]
MAAETLKDRKNGAVPKDTSAAGAEPSADRTVRKNVAGPSEGALLAKSMLMFAALVAALAGVVALALQHDPKTKAAVVDFFPEEVVIAVEDATGLSLLTRGGFKRESKSVYSQDTKREPSVQFTVHFNGDGLSEGLSKSSADYPGLDALIRDACLALPEILSKVTNGDEKAAVQVCEPELGAKLFTDRGRRVLSFFDIEDGQRTYVVPQGLNFVWPLAKVGSVWHPDSVESPVPGKPIALRQLSMSPRVFTVENFMSPDEMDAILEHNRELLKPSEVGFAGWRDKTRTSSTAWDFHSWAARKVQKRSFDLLGMEFQSDMADAVQVLRYNLTEWYKPHTDWFAEKAYDGHDPKVNNGTNRFATVFLYLTDVEEGGHTVFPLSKTHEGYNGEQLVKPGTERTAGYIAQSDAEWVCNTSSTALRSEPKAGNAVLFYSQEADGSLDKLSLHGGCPVIKGTKYSANVWIWNRPKPRKDQAKDGKPANSNGIEMRFHNARGEAVELFWDDGSDKGVFQVVLGPGEYSPMTTYHGHSFFARVKGGTERIFSFTANDKDKGKEKIATIN